MKLSNSRSLGSPEGRAALAGRALATAMLLAPLASCGSLPSLRSTNPVFAGGQTLTHGYVFDDKTLDEIKPGMDVQAVLQRLGQPTNVTTVGNQIFYYVSQTTYQRFQFMKPSIVDQRVFAIYFDKSFKVERLANWGLQDGKIFDFISRTTPASGIEQSFLRQVFSGATKFAPMGF